jgi:hypothetical protein
LETENIKVRSTDASKGSKNIYSDWVKKYIDLGFSVIPGKYGSKLPAIKEWTRYCYQLPTVDEVYSWTRNFEESNLDLALGSASGVIALDLDCTDQRILDVIMPILPQSPVTKIGSKGETRFFRFSGEATEALKFNGEMVVEILSNNKKTTLPPSRHPNGLTYRWVDKSLLDVNKEELPILPPALFAHLGSLLKTKFPDLDQPSFGKIISGRNDELSSFCGKLISESKPISEAVNELVKFDYENNDPPLFTDANEFRHTEPVTNALLFYSNHLNTINNKHYRDSKEYEVPVMPKLAVETEGKLTESAKPQRSVNEIMSLAPTVLKTLHTNLLSNSWVKQPDLALGAVLTLMATLTSRKIAYAGLSPNLYVLNISPSGTGKDKPQSFVKEILINMRADSLLGSGDYVSDASLMDGLANKPVRLDILDEAGGILRSVNSGKSEYNGKMADVLAELYTSSHTKYLGRSTAEGNKGACYRPNVNILASTTPTGFSEGVSRKAIEKGLMGRFLIFLGDSSAPSERLKSFPKLPGFISQQLAFWYGFNPSDFLSDDEETIELGGIKQSYVELKATKAAEDRLDEIFINLDQLRRNASPTDPKLPIIARLYQQMIKLVMISASCRTIQDVPVIQKEDVEFGYELIMYYYENVGEVIDSFIFENRTQMNSQKILNILKQNGGFMTKEELYRSTRTLTLKERENIIDDLLAGGLLSRDLETLEGTQQIVFRARSL